MNSLFARIDSAADAQSAASPPMPRTSCARRWRCCVRSGTWSSEHSSGEERSASANADGRGHGRAWTAWSTQMLALPRAEPRHRPCCKHARSSGSVSSSRRSATALPLANRAASSWRASGRRRSARRFRCFGDADLLTVLLRNLLDNAVRYAPAGSTVTLRIGPDQIEVENDGGPLCAGAAGTPGRALPSPAGQDEGGQRPGRVHRAAHRRTARARGAVTSAGRRRCGSRRSSVCAARHLALIFSSRTRASSRRPVSATCRPGRAGACSARSR